MKNTEPTSEDLEVITYSGSKADEHPISIKFKGRKYKVKTWTPLGKISDWGILFEKFYVETEDGTKWVIALREDGTWILISRKSS